jgi:hypothetical protein
MKIHVRLWRYLGEFLLESEKFPTNVEWKIKIYV